jgi:hypothetical protein
LYFKVLLIATMKYYVSEQSIVRKIWVKADTVLFIFAGAAAEFALNKAVDWLYFTGRLPADPLGRLFSTVEYARHIIFSEESEAIMAIDKITAIHKNVEASRGAQIPDWAYRDVLFMLIDYSIRSFELLDRQLTQSEKEEIFTVFQRVGAQMQLKDLPNNYEVWKIARIRHLNQDLVKSEFTSDLYLQYKKRLGWLRYILLKQVQTLLVPEVVNVLLQFKRLKWFHSIIKFYTLLRRLKVEETFKNILLPTAYKTQIKAIDG